MDERKVQTWFQNRRTKAKIQITENEQLNDLTDINAQNSLTGNTLLYISAASGRFPEVLCNDFQDQQTFHSS